MEEVTLAIFFGFNRVQQKKGIYARVYLIFLILLTFVRNLLS
jgi:hypothetical protein